MTSIYLAGGMQTDWRDQVRERVDARFYDPTDHWLDSLEEYGQWDLHHVASADVLFCYIERDNPSCLGAAVEAGYAAGQGTLVVLVRERRHEHFPDEKVAFLEAVADVSFADLDDGIEYLLHFEPE